MGIFQDNQPEGARFSKTLTEADVGQVISCVSSPFDLRPLAQATAQQAVQRWQETGKPVVILAGEEHNTTSHIIFNIVLLNELLKIGVPAETLPKDMPAPANDNRPRIAIGLERWHNTLGGLLFDKTIPHLNHEKRAALSALDLNGIASLKTALALSCAQSSPVSEQALYKACLNYGVSTRFNDLVCLKYQMENGKKSVRLDLQDPFTHQVAGIDDPLLDIIIDTKSPDGVAKRNTGLFQKTALHIHDTRADIYLLRTGYNHLFGDRIENSFDDSLSALFKSRSVFVPLPVIQESLFDYIPPPPEAQDALKTSIMGTGLSQERPVDEAEELRQAQKLLTQSGLADIQAQPLPTLEMCEEQFAELMPELSLLMDDIGYR